MGFDNILGRPSEPEKTVWRKVIDLYETEGDWTVFEPEEEIDGVQCYCVGGALAKVITGHASDMYDDEKFAKLDPTYEKFADYVGAVKFGKPYQRVYHWNDQLPVSEGKVIVLKALRELDEMERAK